MHALVAFVLGALSVVVVVGVFLLLFVVNTGKEAAVLAARDAWLQSRPWRSERDCVDATDAELTKGWLQVLVDERARDNIADWWYCVLQSNVLLLFEDEKADTPTTILHVDSLTLGLHPAELPRARRWVCKHPILMQNKEAAFYRGEDTCYVFTRTGREKEDWYLALSRACSLSNPVAQVADRVFRARRARHFSTLARELGADQSSNAKYVSAEWFSAWAARMFFSVHDSSAFEDFLRFKIERKLARMKKPLMVDTISLNSVHPGPELPLARRARLRSVDKRGAVEFDLDLEYSGNFTIVLDMNAKVEMPLLPKLEVPIVMSLTLKHMKAEMLVYIPPAPSESLWLGFHQKPSLELEVSTMVGKNYNFNVPEVAELVADKVKASLSEVYLLPHMDDMPLPKMPRRTEAPKTTDNTNTRESSDEVIRLRAEVAALVAENRRLTAAASTPRVASPAAALSPHASPASPKGKHALASPNSEGALGYLSRKLRLRSPTTPASTPDFPGQKFVPPRPQSAKKAASSPAVTSPSTRGAPGVPATAEHGGDPLPGRSPGARRSGGPGKTEGSSDALPLPPPSFSIDDPA